METVREFAYLGVMVSADGGCEAAITRYRWVMFRQGSKLLHGKIFSLKKAVYKSDVRPAMLYGSEAMCL